MLLRKQTYSDPNYRFDKLIDALGGPSGIPNRLHALGYEPPPAATIRKWRQRNKVPGSWAVALIEFALRSGAISSIEDLRP